MKSLLAVVVALAAGHAWACSCANRLDAFPRNGATEVPTNVVLRVVNHFGPREDGFRLVREADQQEVEIDTRVGPGTRLSSITPRTKLEVNTKYQLYSRNSGNALPTGFTTGHLEDHDTPAKPELKSASYKYTPSQDTCGDRRLWTLRIEGGDDATTAKDQLIILVHGEASTDPTQAIGVTTFGTPELDTGICATNFDPPDGDSFALGLQVMDLAGNVSEVSNGRPIRASCAAVPGELFAVLGLLFFARRRS